MLKNDMKRILIIGQKSTYIIKSFEKIDEYLVEFIYIEKQVFTSLEKFFNKLRIPLDTVSLNNKILEKVKVFSPKIIILVGQFPNNILFPKTLKKLKNKNKDIRIFSWTPDNMIKKHNSSIYFEKSIPFYDIHFTTKSNIIDKMYSMGAKKIVFVNQAYSTYDHFPEKINPIFDYNVLFIGSSEIDRYESMCYLAKNGITVNIFGNAWGSFKEIQNLKIHKRPLIGEDFRKAITSSKISICFLRKINDDLQTTRSFEIPACRGFMIAERTKEHLNLFEENKEAVFFSNNNELLEKVKFYLKREKLRNKISENGLKKVTKFNHHYDDMIKKILAHS